MYKVMLVDDEAPALRFLQAIFAKYASDFEIAASCQSGEEALAFMRAQTVDLLMTDISMPGMDGIALAKESRRLYSNMRIVIVSGYAEFEYAQGAIQAAVDDYILKPITIPHITATLDKIRAKLNQTRTAMEPELLSALLGGKGCSQELVRQFYGDCEYHFAYIRWGNLTRLNDEPLTAATPIAQQGRPFHILQGRNADEQILYARSDVSAVDFHTAAKAYTAQERVIATWTLILSRGPLPFDSLPIFVHKAERQLRSSVVIGRQQYLFLSPSSAKESDNPHVPSSTLKKLEYFCQNGSKKHIKEILFVLAADWEKRQTPQIHVYHMIQQLLHCVLPYKSALAKNQDALHRDLLELLGCATHLGELMAGVYTLLFDEALDMDKRLSPEDLFNCALQFIQENYGEALSISQVCSEIGISQTYLSRLFRKYGDTSFNIYLTQCRVEGAMKLIREHPDIRLRDVAACVGYEDSSYFSKVFHQATGKTPSQWASGISEEGARQEEE